MFGLGKKENPNEWITGFQAGFRVGFDQAFTLAYDQMKKSFGFSTEEIRNKLKDEFYQQYDLTKKEPLDAN